MKQILTQNRVSVRVRVGGERKDLILAPDNSGV